MDEQMPSLELVNELSTFFTFACCEMILEEMTKSNHSQICIETTMALIAVKFAAYSLYSTTDNENFEKSFSALQIAIKKFYEDLIKEKKNDDIR
jgi:hypothetical protein